MKKIFRISILMLFLASVIQISNVAQTGKYVKLPVDKNIIIGKLENGLTYYIRKNLKPENRVEMRLAVKAGSVLEDDDQQGLAHFVEHMCFNGTEHFEKNELIHYLQSLGVQFGPEINAYTSFDETVYMLTLPSDSINIVNTGYQVMEDWAQGVTFNNEEIDKERGVIVEEWRLHRGANQRMLDKNLPVLLKGSKYAERLPIGKVEIIENAPYDVLKRFYRDWYRPDLMAFIIVGDIDPVQAELKIKEHFSRLKMSEKSRKRTNYNIPAHKETLVTIATDKEAPLSTVALYYKTDAKESVTRNEYRRDLIYNLFVGMLNVRLSELREKQEPPFVNAGSVYTDFISRDKKVFVSYALAGDKGIDTALAALLTEDRRVQLHGFTGDELDRYKKIILNQYEKAYAERDKTESENYASEYIRNYTTGEPIPGIEFEYEFVQNELPGITLSEVNGLINTIIPVTDRVVVINAPEKEEIAIPSEKEILSLVDYTENKQVAPYLEKLAGTELLADKPEKGSVLFTKKIEDLDAVEFKLSNGIKVIAKQTDFKNDEILMQANSWGGQSLTSEENDMSAKNAASVINESGLGKYSNSDLDKLLAGKTVNVTPFISTYNEGLSGYSSPKDIESMFQLIYLYFTNPRKDKEAFDSYLNKQKAFYRNLLSSPDQFFFDRYNRIKSGNNPRANVIPSEEEWNKVNFDSVYSIYNQRFADASDFTFYFVGSFDIDTLKSLMINYIASLPSNKSKESWNDLGIRPPDKMTDTSFFKGSDPKSLVIAYIENKKEYSEKDAFLISVLGKYLERKYTDVIREELSGAYYVQVNSGMSKVPYPYAYMRIIIPCSPENADSLTTVAINEINRVRTNGISDEEVKTAMEIERREREKDSKTNNFWLNSLSDIYTGGNSSAEIVHFDTYIGDISSIEMQRIVNEYVNTDNYLKCVLYPEKKN